jgi:multicomponent Na+:H+ antiporter subunit F
MNSVLNFILMPMIVAMLIPIYAAWKDDNVWQKMLALASVSSKASIIILVVSVLRDDWMIGVVGAIVLSVGNAGFMLLAQLLKRMENTRLSKGQATPTDHARRISNVD